jgi:CheY-like chemotaxis protein
VQEFRPHVIFLDIQMPGLDGFEVAEDLHELNLRDNLLVAMTIYSDAAHQREAEACGFDLFLPKPPALEEIANAIETAKERFLTVQG